MNLRRCFDGLPKILESCVEITTSNVFSANGKRFSAGHHIHQSCAENIARNIALDSISKQWPVRLISPADVENA